MEAASDNIISTPDLTTITDYLILPGYLKSVVLKINLESFIQRNCSYSKLTPIYQQSKSNDKKRLQNTDVLDINISHCSLIIGNMMRSFNPKLKQTCATVLTSLPGCAQQRIHCDFDHHNEASKNCFFVILALMPDTKLIGYRSDEFTISLDVGDVFIGRGDFFHGGASYENKNVRVHWYFDAPEAKRKHDKLYFGKLTLSQSNKQNLKLAKWKNKRAQDEKLRRSEYMKEKWAIRRLVK